MFACARAGVFAVKAYRQRRSAQSGFLGICVRKNGFIPTAGGVVFIGERGWVRVFALAHQPIAVGNNLEALRGTEADLSLCFLKTDRLCNGKI